MLHRSSGALRDGSSCATSGASILIIKQTYFEDFGVLGCDKNVILLDFCVFCNVLATPTNRASGALRDGSSCATSGASILFIKLKYFEDFGVLGNETSVILIDFRLFCNVLATPTNRASGAFRDGYFFRCI